MSGTTAGDALAPPKDVVGEVLDGEAVLLDLRSGIYFALNETGTRLWELIVELGDLAAVKDKFLHEFDVTAHALERDLVTLVDELLARGLLVRQP